MRVLQVGPFPPPYGGVERNLIALRTFLRSRGIPCGVVNITRHRKAEVDEVYQPAGPIDLARRLATLRYDVIHLHFGGQLTARLLGLYLLCTVLPGRRTVLTFHSGGYPSTPAGRALGPRSLAGFVFRRIDRLIAVNAEIAAFFARLGVARERIRVIAPHAFVAGEAPSEVLPPALEAFAARHAPLLVSVGGLEPEYDVPAQIGLLERVIERHPRAGLMVIGSGSLQGALAAAVASSAARAQILLCGDVPHASTMRAIQRADVLLRTTLYDGDAISIREALHLGTPVVATDNGMRPAGLAVVPVSAPGPLLDAVLRVLDTPRPPAAAAAPDESNLEAVLAVYEEFFSSAGPLPAAGAALARSTPSAGK